MSGSIIYLVLLLKQSKLVLVFFEQNHQNNHVFFNVRGGFHNHTAHHLLAALGLGASSDTLEQIYEQQQKIQQPYTSTSQ